MNYLALYNYIRDVNNNQNVNPTSKFFHGRPESIFSTDPSNPYDPNEKGNDDFLYVYLFPLTSSISLTDDAYQVIQLYTINMIFYKRDRLDSANDQNNEDVISPEMSALQESSLAAGKFLRAFNFNNYTDELEKASEKLIIRSASTQTAIKDTSHVLTGTNLTINVEVPEGFDYCSILPNL